MKPQRFPRISAPLGAAVVTVLALALGGCAQSMSEFAQAAAPGAPQTGQLMLEPTATGPTIGNGVARTAVMVEETTVPVPRQVVTNAPPLPDPGPAAYRQPSSAGGSYPNLNTAPDQPKGKLLTEAEKAKVIAELEALARSQNAATAKVKKAAKCPADTVKPADRLKGETAAAEC